MELALQRVCGRIITTFVLASLLGCDLQALGSPMVPSEALPYTGPPSSGSIQYPFEAPGEIWYEDEGWWEGAEEIDLTQPYGEHDEEDNVTSELTDESLYLNESIFLDIECDVFLKMPMPPNFIQELPPPPLPPFLMGVGEILRESTRRWHVMNSGEFLLEETDDDTYEDELFAKKLDWVSFEDDTCSICEWAKGGNETLNVFTEQPDSNVVLSNAMVSILVGVALTSAAVGATVMGFLLRCRKIKFLPCTKGRNWIRSSERQTPSRNAAEGASSSGNKNSPARRVPTTLPGLALKLWRRGSSQNPLNPCSSPRSENSYSEEPYSNTDVSISTYAELNHAAESVVRLNPSPVNASQNTYSEIPYSLRPTELNLCTKMCGHEGTYENAGYVLSETPSDPNESSTGSNSTPSSAYYSDVSSCDIYTNKKKKKKRKGEDRSCFQSSYPIIGGSLSSSVGVPVICSHVAHQPVHLNLNTVQSQYIPHRETVPVALQLLPRQIGFDQRGLDKGIHQGILQNQNLSRQNPRPLLGIRGHCESNQLSILSKHKPTYNAQPERYIRPYLEGQNNAHLGEHNTANLEEHNHSHFEGHNHAYVEGHNQAHLEGHNHTYLEGHKHPHIEGHSHAHLEDYNHTHLSDHMQPSIEGHVHGPLNGNSRVYIENGVEHLLTHAEGYTGRYIEHTDHHLEGLLQQQSLGGHGQGISEEHLDNQSQEELMLRQYNGNVVQRPLPPLPSRQFSDARRRNLKTVLDSDMQDTPSDV